ncbi:hypothetical protein QCA50_000747 [Cerrena zonata]|uniref:Amino acid permease/ SLC12A domain-containing protein n=1 Tax=Cerrena zonata TaxID=2478898 RepID=A0AAW0GVI9_9APHY
MATPPVLSRSTSSSWTSTSEPKEPLKDDPRLVESLEAADKKPLWKRVLSGNADHQYDTQRGMSERHVMMIAIGGTIGTGIFLSAGSAVATAGPASALMSYFVVGVFCYAVVVSLGEMAAYIPISGTFAVFAARFVSPSMGFTLGWNYWLQWALTIPSELIAAAVILQYWTDALKPWMWALIIIFPIFAMQLIHVRVYGESEYWFAMIKVVMVILFIIVGLIYNWGGVIGHPGPGLSNFHDGQAFIGGFSAFAQTFALAFYSYGGVELVSLAAGETKSPHKAIPRAIKATFFRVVLFYILTILTIGLNINHADPSLLNAAENSNVAASPLTIVFMRAGFGPAVHIVNAVLLTAVLSATNSCFYASSRMLLALARTGQAPAIFGWVNRRGVPVPSLLLSLAVSGLTFLTTIWGEGAVFTWLLNLVGISSLMTWGSIGVISLQFRRAWKVQGRLMSDLPYTQPLFPLLPIFTIVLTILMFTADGYASVIAEPFDVKNIIATYLGVILYAVLYIGYAIYEWIWVKPPYHFIPIEKADLDTDAVWGPGEGDIVRQQDRELDEKRTAILEADAHGARRWLLRLRRVKKHVY